MCWSRKVKTSSGLVIKPNNVPSLPSLETYNRALTFFIEECAKVFDKAAVEKSLSTITVEWWDKIAPRPSTGELNTVVVYDDVIYSGLTIGTLCLVAWRGKLSRSAFIHELLHVIGCDIIGEADPEHLNDLLWKQLERDINARLSANQI